jgi:hypothetical protein
MQAFLQAIVLGSFPPFPTPRVEEEEVRLDLDRMNFQIHTLAQQPTLLLA